MIFSDNMDIVFEDKPIDLLLSSLSKEEKLSANQLLAALGSESESVIDEVFHRLGVMEILPDVEDLTPGSADSALALRLRNEAQLVQKGSLTENLERTDPLRIYLEELAGIPAAGDVAMLADRLKIANKTGETDATVCTALLNLSLNRVVEISCSYAGKGVLLLDLIQEGSMGLWEKLTQYTGDDFSAYRDFWIRWYMTKAVVVQAYAAGLGQKLRQAMEDYSAVDERLLTELGRNPTVEEIAEALHISVQETETVAEMLDNAKMLRRVKTPEPEEMPQEEDQAVEDTAYFQMRQRILELLSVLSEEDAKLLTLRYGLEGGLPQKASDVAKLLNVTEQEVVAREAAALGKLREIQ